MNPHIEASWVELIQFFLSAPNTTCRKERGHGIVNGLLYLGKRAVRTVWPAKCIGWIFLQFRFYRFQVSRGDNAVGIKDKQILSLCPFCSIITCLPRAGILFLKIF